MFENILDPFPMLKSQARRDLRPGVAALRGHRRGRLRCTPFGGRGMVTLRDFWVKKWGFQCGVQIWFSKKVGIPVLIQWFWMNLGFKISKKSGFKFWFPQEWWVWIDFTWWVYLWKMTTFWWRFNGDKVTVVCLVSWIFLGIIITHELEKIYLTK